MDVLDVVHGVDRVVAGRGQSQARAEVVRAKSACSCFCQPGHRRMAPGPPAMDEGIPAMPTVTKPSPASTVTPGPVPQKRKQNASGSSKGKGKGKGSGSEDDDEEDEDGRKRKRNRMALSCRECKRRKVKVSLARRVVRSRRMPES